MYHIQFLFNHYHHLDIKYVIPIHYLDKHKD